MDYKNLNKIEIDENGDVVLQDINNSTITVDSTDTTAMIELIKSINEQQIFELKELLSNQNKQVLKEISKLQEQKDEKNLEEKFKIIDPDIKEFLNEVNQLKIDGLKDNLITNYQLLREYEQLLILEDNPKKKLKYKFEIKGIKENIKEEEKELGNISE